MYTHETVQRILRKVKPRIVAIESRLRAQGTHGGDGAASRDVKGDATGTSVAGSLDSRGSWTWFICEMGSI